MARRPKAGKCVHCLNDPVERNWDHVFPESWYPAAGPHNLYKWQIPSCIPCNSTLGAIEDEFLRLIGMCLDPHNPASASIVQNVLRSMRPAEAKTEREARIRGAVRRRVLGEALVGGRIPDHGVYPGMGEKWGRPVEEQVAVLIPANSFRRLTEKVVRGIFYVEDKKFIEPPYTIEFFALDPANAAEIRATIDRFGHVYSREPGIVVRRAVTSEDGISSLFEIEFWQQFMTYAAVTRD